MIFFSEFHVSMSTDQLLGAVLRKVPDGDPEYLLELIAECGGDISRVFKLLGVDNSSGKIQTTFKVSKAPPQTKRAGSGGGVVQLHTPEQVKAANICCSLHLNVLDKPLANALLCELMEDSQDWKSSKFYLFDREVQSPHTSAAYADDETLLETQASTYQGRLVDKILPFSKEMADARDAVQNVVNGEIRKRTTRSLPKWISHFAICNHYKSKDESVGYHSDQLTHLGPKPTIAGLSLGSCREFRFRHRHEKNSPVYSIRLPHNSLVIMHAGNQELFKHSIVPVRAVDTNPISGTSRISITYRYYHPEYTYEKVPKCRCDKPMILRTTVGLPYKYIWQCGTAYQTNKGCGEVIEKDL